jgi:hypothetical protein
MQVGCSSVAIVLELAVLEQNDGADSFSLAFLAQARQSQARCPAPQEQPLVEQVLGLAVLHFLRLL